MCYVSYEAYEVFLLINCTSGGFFNFPTILVRVHIKHQTNIQLFLAVMLAAYMLP